MTYSYNVPNSYDSNNDPPIEPVPNYNQGDDTGSDPQPADPTVTGSGPGSNIPNITITDATNNPDSYSQASNQSQNRNIQIITPEKLRTQVLDFPPNPTVGQEYNKHKIQYTWNGTHWEANNAKYFVDRFTRFDISTYGELP
jgi:hypothetical protein